ncbi:MAG: radical SAM protein [Deltaproteobacteria bacterium]|nr:radical SAM protein [Deltaproteobacteria bacterium]
MQIAEITVKTALVKSGIPGVEYVINPYLGCGHGCKYCYAVFMKKYARRFQGQPWGSFVEAKVNIAEVLRRELARKRQRGRAMLSSVCDPYQPVEGKYRLTRQILSALKEFGWGIDILTRSPLVTRDLDILAGAHEVSLGFSIPTDDESVRRVTEPQAPPIPARINALKQVREAGINPWVFIAPLLPMNPARLAELIAPYASRVMMDPLNYRRQVQALFLNQGWDYALTDEYAATTRAELGRRLGEVAEDQSS